MLPFEPKPLTLTVICIRIGVAEYLFNSFMTPAPCFSGSICNTDIRAVELERAKKGNGG